MVAQPAEKEYVGVRPLTVVVGADLQGLITTHEKTDLLGVLVLHEADVTGTALLPLVGLLDETEKLGAPGGERIP